MSNGSETVDVVRRIGRNRAFLLWADVEQFARRRFDVVMYRRRVDTCEPCRRLTKLMYANVARSRDDNIAWMQIAVNDAMLVRVCERTAYLPHDGKGARKRQSPRHNTFTDSAQRFACRQFEGEKTDRSAFLKIVDPG